MKNTAKKIISVCLCFALMVGYFPLLNSASATNEYLEATNADWKMLENDLEYLLTFSSFYDYNLCDSYDDIIPSNCTDLVYWHYFNENVDCLYGGDPLGYFTDSEYCVFDGDKIDWIVTNVFNQTPDHNLNTENRYYYEGKYYVAFYPSSCPIIEASVVYTEMQSDGSYKIQVKETYYVGEVYGSEDEVSYTYDIYIDAYLKTVDGKRLWSFFYIGLEKTIHNIYGCLMDKFWNEKFAIYDLDNDGTTELIVLKEDDREYCFYDYCQGQVTMIGAAYWHNGVLYKTTEKNKLCSVQYVGSKPHILNIEKVNDEIELTKIDNIPDNITDTIIFYAYDYSMLDLCTVAPEDEYITLNNKSIAVFSTEKSFTVETGDSMWLAFGLMEDDVLLGEWIPMAITISDPTVISLSEYEETDYGYSLEVTGKKEGSANLTITDTETGLCTDIVITVQDSYSKTYSYPIAEINTFYPDNKWEDHIETNFYNINGLYVNNYICSKNGNNHNVKFDVYNEKYHIGAVDVYDADGNWIGSEKIDKFTEMTSLYEWGEQVYYLFAKGDWVAYTHPMHTKKTEIKLEVPDGGYFVISNNFAESPGCFYYNSVDIFIQGATVALELAVGEGDVDNNVKKFIEEMKGEIKKNKTFSKMLYEAFANVGNDTLTSISQNIMDGHFEQSFGDIAGLLENILNSTLSEFKWKACLKSTTGIGESLFEKFAGPAGTALKIGFSISKSANMFGQAINIARSMDVPYVNVYSKIPEGFVAPNGTIVNTNGNVDTEAVLQVFRIFNNDSVETLINDNSSQKYELYNICFVKNDKLVQPNGKVKVYIPIPNDMKDNTCSIYRQETDSSWTAIYTKVEGNYLVFETDHFSLYAIVGNKESIEISALPKKTSYYMGDTLDMNGLEICVNGKKISEGVYCEPTVLYETGTQAITVRYGDLSTDFNVSVALKAPEIRTPSTTTISYGDSIILHADVFGTLPKGATIQWFVDNDHFEKVASNDGRTCKITPKSSGNTTFTIKVVSSKGEVLAQDSQVMTSKAGLFDKIIAFFKMLFGLTKTIPQVFKGIF